MTTTPIPDSLCSEILRLLDEESAFLTQVETSATSMGQLPVGRAFPDELIRQLVALRKQIGHQQIRRATLQTLLQQAVPTSRRAVRLSTLEASPEMNRLLQQRRVAVRRQTIMAQATLRAALAQLNEANAVLVAVLESILGTATDMSRYDSDGRPTPRISHVEGKRVA